jgi:Fe-S-cluster containining protein
MELEEKVRAVEKVLTDLDTEIASFQAWSGLHCKWGCGKCCFKADIEASVLEFLPFAHYLYKNDQAFEWLEKIKTTDNPELCVILNPLSDSAGMCSEYPYRGLICRLFGYSARTNKYGKKELVTCQIIKSEQSAQFELAKERIESEGDVPLMSNYYMQLHAIDFTLAQQFLPINEAIKRAIDTILHYYAYRT